MQCCNSVYHPLINPEIEPQEWLKQRSGLLTAGTYGMCVKLKVKSNHTSTSKQVIINKLVAERLNPNNELAMNQYSWLNMIKPVAFNALKKLFTTGLGVTVLPGMFVVTGDNKLAGTVDAYIPSENAIAIFITPSSTEQSRYTSITHLELDVDVIARVNFLVGITEAKSCYVVFVDPRFTQAPLVIKKVTPEQEEVEATIANAYKLFAKVQYQSNAIELGINNYNKNLKQEFTLTDTQLQSIYNEFNYEFETIARTKYNVE